MTLKAKTLVFCENYEYGDIHVMEDRFSHNEAQMIQVPVSTATFLAENGLNINISKYSLAEWVFRYRRIPTYQ